MLNIIHSKCIENKGGNDCTAITTLINDTNEEIKRLNSNYFESETKCQIQKKYGDVIV